MTLPGLAPAIFAPAPSFNHSIGAPFHPSNITDSLAARITARRLPYNVPELLALVGFKSDYTGAGGRLYSIDGYWIPVLEPDKYSAWASAIAYLQTAVQEMGKK